MDMPGRNSGINYNFSFNGKLDDKSDGWQTQDYGYRTYDYRLGRFSSTDPLAREFPFYSPYSFAGNKPICSVDLDGAEDIYFMKSFKMQVGATVPQILFATEMGKKFMDDFERTVPCEGESANQGWDIFSVAQSTGSTKGGQTDVFFINGSMYQLDENGNNMMEEPLVTTKEKILEARKTGSGVYYEYFKKRLGEIWTSEEFENTLKNNRNILVVTINPDFLLDPSLTDAFTLKSQQQQLAYALGHEFIAHASDVAKGDNYLVDDHLKFNGINGPAIGPGTPSEELGKQIQKVKLVKPNQNKPPVTKPKNTSNSFQKTKSITNNSKSRLLE